MTIKSKLQQFEERVATLWPGVKTKIVLALSAIAPIAAVAGYQVDAQAVTQYMEQWWAHLMAAQAALIALAAWTRRLTNVYANLKTGKSKKTSTTKKAASRKKRGGGTAASLAVLALAATVVLSGCGIDPSVVKSAVEQQGCEVPLLDDEGKIVYGRNGEVVTVTYKSDNMCGRVAEAEVNRSQERAITGACTDMAKPVEPSGGQVSEREYESYAKATEAYNAACRETKGDVAISFRIGSGQQERQRASNTNDVAIQYMRSQTAYDTAWIRAGVPTAGNVAGAAIGDYFDAKVKEDYYAFQNTLAEGASAPRNMTVNASTSGDSYGEGATAGSEEINIAIDSAFARDSGRAAYVPGDGSVLTTAHDDGAAIGSRKQITDPTFVNGVCDDGESLCDGASAPFVQQENPSQVDNNIGLTQ